MKNISKIILTIIVLSTILSAQEKKFFIGASSNYLVPLSGFADRYNSSIGGTIYFGQNTSEDFSWIGKFEYMKFDDLNTEELYKKASLETDNGDQIFNIPLEKLSMEFEAFTIGVEGQLKFIKSDVFNSAFSFGFGFINWEHKRSAYRDTIFVTINENDSPVKLKEFDVPKNTQSDWNGVLTIGLNNEIRIAGDLLLNIGTHYKLIIGELWPALALDIENVSGVQMIDLRAGIKFSF